MKFNYQTRTEDGKIQAGIIEASSKEAALSILQKNKFYVTYLEEDKLPFYAKKLAFGQGVSTKEVVLFSRQIAMMFNSKIPLIESLKILSDQTKNMAFKEKILNISETVEGGIAFSEALSAYPKVFPLFYVAMVKAGEASGKLSESLAYLADHLEREYGLAAKVKGALLYPALVLLSSVGIINLMIHMVIPQLKTVLEESGAEIPTLTANVLLVSGILKDYGFLVFLGFAILLFLAFQYNKTKKGKTFFDKLFIKIPIIGPFLKTMYLARLAENLSTLISGGLMITTALELSANTIGNAAYQEAVFLVRDEVRKGVPISSILSLYPEIFPPIFIQMTLVGEKTGNLDGSLMQIATFYQAEVERGITNILSILEPALILTLGVVVAGLIFSVLMPLYETMAL